MQRSVVLTAAALAAFLAAADASAADKIVLNGRVASGTEGIGGSTVSIYAATNKAPRLLGRTTSDPTGNFRLHYEVPDGDAVVYAVAEGGRVDRGPANDAIRLMTVVGATRYATLNELTTVAAAYSLAWFLDGAKVSGPKPGLPNAGAVFFNLASAEGKAGEVIGTAPNGAKTEALATLASLADVLSTCVRDAGECGALFEAATPPGGEKPKHTLAAAHAIARNPVADASGVFALMPTDPPYRPVLKKAPVAWTLALKYVAGGLDGPGAMAFDKQGNAWVTNNFMPPATTAGDQMTVLSPTGKPLFGSPITGGGLDGTGWGIAVADDGKVWVGNYHGGSMSEFSRIGKPLTKEAFAAKELEGTQGVTIDFDGNVWAAGNSNDRVVRFEGGDRGKTKVITAGGIENPFAIAVDADNNIWVANAGKAGSVTKLDAKGEPLGKSPFKFGSSSSPKGIAVDGGGNVWVADFLADAVHILDKDGAELPIAPVGATTLDGAWGLALDGDENVWVASFLLERVTKICGRNTETCPPGSKMGDIISPEGGFRSQGFQHLTGVSVDPSGNLWLANNWRSLKPVRGGEGLVVLIGAAAPVKTPLIGPPRQPAMPIEPETAATGE